MANRLQLADAFGSLRSLRGFSAAPNQPSKKRKSGIPPEYIGDPIHLSASVTGMAAGTSGSGVNVKALRNPGPGGIEIWVIKFRLRSTAAISGATVACRLDLGDFPLTNGFVPVYAFGRAENLVVEQQQGIDGAGTISGGNAFYATYTARLSRPIYVPPGAVIRPQLQHKGHTAAPVDVHVSMIGRMLPVKAPLPERLTLPYWAAYVSKTFQLGTVDSDNSTESELANPFDVPLYMDRFMGRIGFYAGSSIFSTQGTTTELEDSPYLSIAVGSGLGDVMTQISCSIVDSDGFPVVKKLTPFRMVFDAETRSWPLTHQLAPGGYYLVSLANSAWAVADPTQGGSGAVFAQPCVSMLGWREVA